MPPFGALYGVPVYMDGCFREQPEFFFRGGAHDESIAMLVADYESLARPVFGQWCFHDPPRAPLRAPRAAAVPAAPGRKGRAMRCREVMNKNVVVCEEGESVAACARLMRDRAIGFLPVVDGGGQVVGVLTDRDLTLRVLAEEREPETPVRAVMTRDVRICRPWDSLREAERKMAAVRKSRLVVADEDGCCAGVISLSDIAQADTRALAGHVLYEITQREARPAPRTGA
jgi:CBS domain-containing protein